MKKLARLPENLKTTTVEIISVLLLVLFTYAGVSKLIILQEFHVQLEQFPFISEYAGLIAWGLPAVLILVSFLLFSNKFRLIALYASFLLLILFSLYIIAVLNFAEFIPCSCSGIISSFSWNEHLFFNLGCTLLTAIGIAFSHDIQFRNQKSPFLKKGVRL